MMKKLLLIGLMSIIFLISFRLIDFKYLLKSNISKEGYLRLSQIKNLVLGRELDKFKFQKIYDRNFMKVYDFSSQDLVQYSVKIKNRKLENQVVSYFKIPPIYPAITVDEVNTGYIDFLNRDLYYATKNGVFFKIIIKENVAEFTPIKSNIKSFFDLNFKDSYFDAFTTSKFGIKDIMIDENYLYVSYIKKFNNESFNLSVIRSAISDSLIFKEVFSPLDFISSNNEEFYPIQSGGRIVKFKKDSILVSIGDFRDRLKAQSFKSVNGKVLAINKNDGAYRIVSMGHRNPQGLDYLLEKDFILSTDHGPYGGDEINLSTIPDSIQNFGWPISSYGIHYGTENALNDNHSADLKRVIESAPLHKSHSDYGFTEPIKYYNLNPAVSEARFLNVNNNNISFLVSSLGYDSLQGYQRPHAKSINVFNYDLTNKKVIFKKQFKIDERVRDIALDSLKKRIFFMGESTGIIGYFNLYEIN